jgi:hypothetical protein
MYRTNHDFTTHSHYRKHSRPFQRPGLSAQTLGGAEKFIEEMMVVDVDQIILINIRHRLHHSAKIIADSEPRQVF